MSDSWNKSFIASLYSVTVGHRGRIGISLIEGGVADDGWLQILDDHRITKPVNFRFHYISHSVEDNRIHCNITCTSDTGQYRGARLGVSDSGYLGFYQVAQVTDFWKLEPAGDWVLEEEQDVLFTLRDHNGFRVANEPHYGGFLNIHQGEILQIKAKVLRVIDEDT